METSVEESDPSSMEYALKRSLISRNKLAIIFKTPSGETEYCCVVCPAKFSDKKKMEVHLCTHSKEYRFLCGICGTGLKRKEHLDRHVLEHLEVRPHKCPECGKAFKRKEHLNIHRQIHKGDRDQVCTLCNRSFNRKDHLQKHLQTHSKLFLEQNMYPLDEHDLLEIKEEKEFIDINGDDELMIKDEAVDEDSKELNSDSSYMEYDMEASDALPSGEDESGSYCALEPSIDIRTPDSHTNARPFVCNICFKSYKRKDHLKIHSWTHMKKDKTCTGCGKAFHMDSQLAAHMHTCMQVHLKQKAGQEGAPNAEEFHLDELVANNSLLVETRRRRLDPESRPHQCSICGRRFKRKQHLKVHANVHLKQEASIWCSLCSEGFVSNSQFEQHQCRAAHAQPDPAPRARKENTYPADLFVQEMIEETSSDASSPAGEETEKEAEGEYIGEGGAQPAGVGAGAGGGGGAGAWPAARDEQNIPVPQRVFVCRYCQKPFKRRDHYKIHLHIHTGVKDFFCPDCGKGFYRKDHLQKHSQTHWKQKPKPKKQLPDLFPISMMPKKSASEVKPEITITAPHKALLRVPLQIKVPYQVVLAEPPA